MPYPGRLAGLLGLPDAYELWGCWVYKTKVGHSSTGGAIREHCTYLAPLLVSLDARGFFGFMRYRIPTCQDWVNCPL